MQNLSGVERWLGSTGHLSIGSGASAATSPFFRNASQKSAGILVLSAAWSSRMRAGLLAPGMTAAEAGCAREKCSAAALMGTSYSAHSAEIFSTLAAIAGGTGPYSK